MEKLFRLPRHHRRRSAGRGQANAQTATYSDQATTDYAAAAIAVEAVVAKSREIAAPKCIAVGEAANVSEQDILDHGAKQIADLDGGASLVDDEGLDAAFRAAKSTLTQTYTTSSVLHVQLEPVNALAFEKDGIFEIHTGNQWWTLMLPVLPKALGLPQERIVLRSYYLVGSFGRRLNGDYTVPAALAAKGLGKPVKMVLTRPPHGALLRNAHLIGVTSSQSQKNLLIDSVLEGRRSISIVALIPATRWTSSGN